MAVQEFEVGDLQPFPMDDIVVPVIHLTFGGPPDSAISVDGAGYTYDRSYPIKGHSAVLPGYLREQLGAGKKPLLIERIDRFYVYFAAGS